MERRGIQVSIRGMLALVACVAVNIWCFKVSALFGFVSLNITKHVIIAQLCLAVGVNGRRQAASTSTAIEPANPLRASPFGQAQSPTG